MNCPGKEIVRGVIIFTAFVLFFFNKSDCVTVTIDPGSKYQTFEGWGTSLCWWAHQEGGGSQAYLDRIADVLMDPDSGLGYSIFRYNIGGGDKSGHTEIEPNRAVPGYKTTENGDYNWDADLNQRNIVTALAAKGKKIQQDVIWEAFSNSPPWWMTVSGCADGNPNGGDNLKSTYFDKFADYLTEVIKHFKDNWGITFRTVDPFNEPNAGWWKGNNNQEGCNFKNEQPRMVKLLGKSLVAKGLFPATHVSVADENSISAAISGIKTYDDSALSFVSQINTHGYSGRSAANFTSMATLATSKKKTLWMSESGPLSGTGGQDISMFMAQNIIEDLKLMKVSAWIDWQSYAGGGDWETIKVNKSTLAIVPSKRCYMQAAFGRFIRPGSQIIESSDPNTLAALVPRTGNLVVIVRNGGNASVNYTFDLSKVSRLPTNVHVYQFLVSSYKVLSKLPDISITDKQFSITVPTQSVTSFAIPGVVDPVAIAPQVAFQSNRTYDFTMSNRSRHSLNFLLPSPDEYDIVFFSGSGKVVQNIHGRGLEGNNEVDIGRYHLANGLYFVQLKQKNAKKYGILNMIK